jgi:hypothetical protein
MNHYKYNSCLGNKYAGYSLKLLLNCGLMNANFANDDVVGIVA